MTLVAHVTHRQPAADVSDEEERVVFEVAHHGVAAAQLRGPAVPLVVVADGAVADHGQDEGEDPLMGTGGRGRDERKKQMKWTYTCDITLFHAAAKLFLVFFLLSSSYAFVSLIRYTREPCRCR